MVVGSSERSVKGLQTFSSLRPLKDDTGAAAGEDYSADFYKALLGLSPVFVTEYFFLIFSQVCLSVLVSKNSNIMLLACCVGVRELSY